jgi:large subunit ribosomal protein L19
MKSIEQENMKSENVPVMAIGDSVKVHAKIKEGDKERIQVFGGVVIAQKGGGALESFTVRRVSHGVGVEKVFPLHSPHIEKIEIERSAHVRRAKLYYLRALTGKKARLRKKD